MNLITSINKVLETIQNGVHSTTKWSGRVDKYMLVRKNKSNVKNYWASQVILVEAIKIACYVINVIYLFNKYNMWKKLLI